MVTHDLTLRKLAHRVIHMLDGRVLREEHMDPERRRTALRELADSDAARELERVLQAEREVPAGGLTVAGGGVGAKGDGSMPSDVSSAPRLPEVGGEQRTERGEGAAGARAGESAAAGGSGVAGSRKATFVVRRPTAYATFRIALAQRERALHGGAGGAHSMGIRHPDEAELGFGSRSRSSSRSNA